MFGFYRTFLACMVIAHHLGGILMLGPYAVFGFYMLSGYLMTLILHDKYGFSINGFSRYAINRLLRIFPSYWFASILSLILIMSIGEEFSKKFDMFIPKNLISIVQNGLLIIGPNTSLVPQAWTLTVEIFFYLCIGLGISRTKQTTAVWFIVSLLYAALINFTGGNFTDIYVTIFAASLPFSAGALLYHFRKKVPPLMTSDIATIVLFFLLTLNFIVAVKLQFTESIGFYTNLVIAWGILASFVNKRSFLFISYKLDSRIGDLSYPIYLVHLQCGLILSALGLSVSKAHPQFAVFSMPLIIILSWAMDRYIDKPVEKLRERFKV